MKKNYNAISLFTGAMGLDLGIEAAGFNVLACVENDKFCIETIRKNRPNIKLYDKDINIVDPAKILSDLNLKAGDIDLVVGGPPCQPFSTAGKRRGLEDFRGNVIIRFLDYVKTIKPKYFILENVRGIYYAKLSVAPPEYKDYKNIIDLPGSVIYFLYKEFTKLGYAVSFNLFDSSLYSVPQKRERFLMFGSRDGGVIKIPHPTTANHPKTLRDAIGKIQQQHQDFVKLREVHLKYLKRLKSGQYWKNLPEELQEEAMGKSYKLQGGKTGFYRRLSWDIPSPTLVTYPAMPATMLVHPDELRPLSIQEYAQIQQFPNKWEISGNITKIYKQIGNAVPVGLGKMAGLAIINHIEENNTQKEYDGETSRYNRTSYKEFIKDFETKVSLQKQLKLMEL